MKFSLNRRKREIERSLAYFDVNVIHVDFNGRRAEINLAAPVSSETLSAISAEINSRLGQKKRIDVKFILTLIDDSCIVEGDDKI